MGLKLITKFHVYIQKLDWVKEKSISKHSFLQTKKFIVEIRNFYGGESEASDFVDLSKSIK